MSRPRIVGYLSLIIAAIGFGSIPVFSSYLSLLGVPSLQQSLGRAVFTVSFLLIGLGIFHAFRGLTVNRKHMPYFVLYGLIGIGASIIVYIAAIAIGTPVIVAVSLTYLYPANTLILARLFLKEPINRIRLIAVPLSISGAIIVSLPVTFEVAPIPPAGILLALSNSVFAASYVVLGRKWSAFEGYNPTVTTFWGYVYATLWMAPLILSIQLFISDPRIVGFKFLLPPEAWLLLLGFAFFGSALPYTLVNVGVKNIDASAASIILLLDPISAVLLSYLFMNQLVGFWQLIGATLILLATVLIALEPKLTTYPAQISASQHH